MRMYGLLLIVSLSIIASACAKTDSTVPASPQLSKPATIRDILESMVEPSADYLFEAVREIVDERGIQQIEPKSDAEWAEVRRHVFVLLEVPNLLTMTDRKVANSGDKAEY